MRLQDCPSPDCEHTINTCKACLRKWVEASIEDGNFKTGAAKEPEGDDVAGFNAELWGVGCPECSSVMRLGNVQAAVPKKVLNRQVTPTQILRLQMC